MAALKPPRGLGCCRPAQIQQTQPIGPASLTQSGIQHTAAMVQEHSPQLVWQIVKGWNSHIVKGLNGTNRKGGGIILSKEPGNLYNKHSYKYSGICNDKTLHIEQDQGNVKVVRNRKGSVNRPVSAKVGATRKRHIRLLSGNLGKEVQGYRPDLKKAALARASAVHKSIRVQKGGGRKFGEKKTTTS